MRVILTELEKTILLAFLVFGRDKFVLEERITSKFPIRQRKTIMRYIKKLAKGGLLVRHSKEASYKLSEDGLKRAARLLAEGARLWTYK